MSLGSSGLLFVVVRLFWVTVVNLYAVIARVPWMVARWLSGLLSGY